jgi:hypothetical protein
MPERPENWPAPGTIHEFHCETCLDRGWVIEQGFSPELEHRAECVPCPDCRPKPEPARRSTVREAWLVSAILIAALLVAIFLV